MAAAAADGGPAKGAEGKRAGGESLGDGVPTSKDLIDFGRPMELRTFFVTFVPNKETSIGGKQVQQKMRGTSSL